MPNSKPVMKKIKVPHWTVKTNYTLRTASFALVFAIIVVHLWGKNNSPTFWCLIALQFLVYPHLLFWRARLAHNSQQAEVNNLVLDSFVIGMWVAALQFPLWLTFALWISTSLNITISRGTKGMLLAVLAFSSGALISIVLFGLHVSPDTGWPVTLLCMIGTAVYLLAVGIAANGRNQQLRKTREQLRLGEQTLNATNETLQQQLTEINILQTKLKEQVIRDPLTSLYNRRYLDTIVKRELARCERERQYLSLMMIDIDHFKQVNDIYGHQAGDEVLKNLAAMLLDKVRVTDVVCRYGGEEFLLLLPNMPQEIGLQRADQWRSAFAATTVLFGEFRIQTTLSIGIATYPNHGESAEELIRYADLALYRAKADGRNRVVLFSPDVDLSAADS